MTIRHKTLLVTLLAVLGAGAVALVSFTLILGRGFTSIEQGTVTSALERVRFALDHEADALENIALDWASWDNTYQFIQDRNARYLQSNVTTAALTNLQLDFILFVNDKGELVYAKMTAPPADGTPRTWYRELGLKPFLERCLGGGSVKGLVKTSQGVGLVAAQPILTSAGVGHPRGMVLLGWFLTPAEVQHLEERLRTGLTAYRYSIQQLPDDFRAARRDIAGDIRRAVVVPRDENTVSGYVLLADVYGRPAVMVRADLPRDVHRQGRLIMLWLAAALVVLMALLGATMQLLLQRLVTSRLSALTSSLGRIAARHDASDRVAVQGTDELGSLAAVLNDMLAAIEHSQKALRENEARLRTVLDSVQTGIMIVDAASHSVLEVNDTVLDMTGFSREDLLGKACPGLICPGEESQCALREPSALARSAEQVVLTKDGRRLPVLKRAVRVELDGKDCVLESLLDISDRKQAEEAVRYQAYHDSLTGLPNRLRFQQHLTEALAQARHDGTEVAVLMLDLDHFKTVNDTLGHSAGDKLLQATTTRLSACLRERDAVARLGGDEFAVLLTRLHDPESAGRVARRVLKALRPPFRIDGVELHSTASIGISLFPRDGDSVEELLRHADVALYHAKDLGRDTLQHYATWLDAGARARLSLENDLRHALDRGEFILHYQPQVQLPSGRILGLEALLRWMHPQAGPLMPAAFLPVAESAGMMHAIGEWVLAEACRQARAWRQAGLPPVRIAVNLSASQFRQERLAAAVTGALQRSALEPELLELEITETAVMTNVELAAALMSRLKETGTRICLDDFGVGNTSLVYLKQLPIDTLKVDGSFLRTVENNPTDAAIVSAIIGIGDSLGLLVIAEGVETLGQMRFLRDRGCNTMQGFLFSRPVAPADVPDLLREGSLKIQQVG